MLEAGRRHWPEYMMEGAELGIFMVSAALFTALLEHPASPARQAIGDAFTRRALIGAAMGLTAVGLIFSPWGKRSGGHMNPAVTLSFLRLGKIQPVDAAGYIVAQFIGGAAGVVLMAVLLHGYLSHPAVNYVVTIPGAAGVGLAFAAELLISFVLMGTVLVVSNTASLARWTGVFAGALVAAYIAFEAPLSGMSINPARTFGSAVVAGNWTALWLYFAAPVLGMLLAAEAYVRLMGFHQVFCAKLHHENRYRCIFACRYGELKDARPAARIPAELAQ